MLATHALHDAAEAAGGIEMESAGFHWFVSDPMRDLRRWHISFHRFTNNSPNTGGHSVSVDLGRDEVLQATIIASSAQRVDSDQGGHDVRIQLAAAARPHSKLRHFARVEAEKYGQIPRDKGVAFVWRNYVTASWTCGQLAELLTNDPSAFIPVAIGLTLEDAEALIAVIQQSRKGP